MGADIPMIPHESTLFSRACKPTSLEIVPYEVTWQSKPQLAAAMVQGLHQASALSFKYIVADCLYGNSPDFWAACEGRMDRGFVPQPRGEALALWR